MVMAVVGMKKFLAVLLKTAAIFIVAQVKEPHAGSFSHKLTVFRRCHHSAEEIFPPFAKILSAVLRRHEEFLDFR